MAIEEAIDKALEEMPNDFEIKPYLIANKVGVKKMLFQSITRPKQWNCSNRKVGKNAGKKEKTARRLGFV